MMHSLSQLLRRLIISSRPISWINTAFPFAAGYLATGGTPNAFFWVATLYFLVPYNFLVYVVNDVYDYASDIQNPRKNSIEGGILPPSTHRFMLTATLLSNGIFLAYLMASGTLLSGIILGLVALGAVTYSAPPLRLKERPVFDSVNSSLHFVGPLLFALALTGWGNSYIPYVLAFFFWGCASHAFGAVQDILPDREAGIASIATRFGAKATVRLSLGLYVLAGLCLAISGWPAVIVCLPLALYIVMVLPYIHITDAASPSANKGWRQFLALNQLTGFTVTILLIAAAVGVI